MEVRTNTPILPAPHPPHRKPILTVRIHENRTGERHAGKLRAWIEQGNQRASFDLLKPQDSGLSALLHTLHVQLSAQAAYEVFEIQYTAAPCLIERAIAANELRRADIGRRIYAETRPDKQTGWCDQCGTEAAHA